MRANVTLDVRKPRADVHAWEATLAPGTRHAVWGHTVTTSMATIPALLTVLTVSAMYLTHCAHHLLVTQCPLWPPNPPPTPPVSTYTLPSSLFSSRISRDQPPQCKQCLRAWPIHHTLVLVPPVCQALPNQTNPTWPAGRFKGTGLLCPLCGAPAQEASPLAVQTEGMCLPGNWTGEIRGLTAERGNEETRRGQKTREGE